MIFIPEKEKCITWNEMEEGIYILYFYNNNDELPIKFFWRKQNNQYDPFYLSVTNCMHSGVLNCPSNSCNTKPQLRYNKIINKWYCCCPSSCLGTTNDDQNEIDTKLIDTVTNDKKGYCNNPIKAILRWNELNATCYKNIALKNMNQLKNIISNGHKNM